MLTKSSPEESRSTVNRVTLGYEDIFEEENIHDSRLFL